MAKGVTETDYRRMAWDRLDGLPYPGEHQNLFGHDEALDKFAGVYKSTRMHHAWLISGRKGIGKATFSIQIAGHVFRNPDPANAPDKYIKPQPDDPLTSQIGRGGHPNVLILSRPWDSRTKKFKTVLTVDEVRRTISFFGTTAGENTWRICIVDTADDMNKNAANALLKILEEPPERTLFFVLTNAAGRLLPTIRSRCRQLPLRALNNHDLACALSSLGADVQSLSDEEKNLLANISGGSVRRAWGLLQQDGLKLYHRFEVLLGNPGSHVPQWAEVHKLADELARKNNEEKYRQLFDFARYHVGKSIHEGVAGINAENSVNSVLSNLARMCEVWENTTQSAQLADSYNLDRKQVILDLFGSLAQAR